MQGMELQAGAKLLLLLLLLWVIYCGHAQIIRKIARYASIVEVTNGGTWGDWAWPEMCPDGYFASGFSIKVKPQIRVLKDRDMPDCRAEIGDPLAGAHFSSPPHLGGAPSRHSWR